MTSQATGQDKRRFLRIPKVATVTISRLEYPPSRTTVEAKTINLSEKGICFSTSTQYQINTLLNLKIDLQGWQQYLQNVVTIVDDASLTKPLTAIVEVEWSTKLPGGQGYEVGVRFKDIYEDDYQAFRKYLDGFTEQN